jgi:hypothetical protein
VGKIRRKWYIQNNLEKKKSISLMGKI